MYEMTYYELMVFPWLYLVFLDDGQLNDLLERNVKRMLAKHQWVSPNRMREMLAAILSHRYAFGRERIEGRRLDFAALYDAIVAAEEQETLRAKMVRLSGSRTLVTDEETFRILHAVNAPSDVIFRQMCQGGCDAAL